CGMKIVALIPSSRAAHATAWPWLPALAATTPASRSAGERLEAVLNAPRILNEPVGCRFSALAATSRPTRRGGEAKPYHGVTRAWSPIRSRAARTSASVGVVVVAKVKDQPKNGINRAQRIELPALDLVEQPRELGIVGDLALEVTPRSGGRDREDLGGEV